MHLPRRSGKYSGSVHHALPQSSEILRSDIGEAAGGIENRSTHFTTI
jgi:hypothetical protein